MHRAGPRARAGATTRPSGGGVQSSIVGVSGVIRPSGETATKPLSERLTRSGKRTPRSSSGANSGGGDTSAPAEPGVERAREVRVADGEARVRDAAAAREQVERELHRLEVRVRRHATEVRGALARRGLRPLDGGLPFQLVVDERSLHVPAAAHERLGERDRVLHRQLRPRADREVRRVRRVAEQHEPAVVPDAVRHLREVEPERAVGEELAAARGRWRRAARRTRGSRPRSSRRAPPRATSARRTRR